MNHGPVSDNAFANDAPLVVTALFEPLTVRLVIRPPHCSAVRRPLWSMPDSDSRELTVRLVNVPIDGYAAWICPAVIESVHEWLFQESVGTPSHSSGRAGR